MGLDSAHVKTNDVAHIQKYSMGETWIFRIFEIENLCATISIFFNILLD